MCIDDNGRGHAAVCLRPDHPSDDYPVSRATEVKVLLAGGIAEKRFDRESSGKSTAGDERRIRELQAEDPSLSDLAPLETESRELIKKNWDVIRELAERLLRKNPERRMECVPWTESEYGFARYLFGEEISEVLPEAKALLLGGR